MPCFRKEFGEAVDKPVNAIAYELTNGGDTIRGKPETWEALYHSVCAGLWLYEDMRHLSPRRIKADLDAWLRVNEQKD